MRKQIRKFQSDLTWVKNNCPLSEELRAIMIHGILKTIRELESEIER
jgi:hypothetical protein